MSRVLVEVCEQDSVQCALGGNDGLELGLDVLARPPATAALRPWDLRWLDWPVCFF